MSNVLSEHTQQQVLALGRLGWSLRRIEPATGVRRQTASVYLKAAGIPVCRTGGADMFVDLGDSGSPVFFNVNGYTVLIGIVWGAPGGALFRSIDGVHWDLGPLSTFRGASAFAAGVETMILPCVPSHIPTKGAWCTAVCCAAFLVSGVACAATEVTGTGQGSVASFRVSAVPAGVVGTGVGGTIQLAAAAYSSSGAVLNNAGRVLWSAGDSSIASVDQNGLVRGLNPGTTWIRATLTASNGRFSDSLAVNFYVLVGMM